MPEGGENPKQLSRVRWAHSDVDGCRLSFSGGKPLFTAAGRGGGPSLCCFQVASLCLQKGCCLMSHGLPVAGCPLLLHAAFCAHVEEQKTAPADNQSRLF